MQSIINKKDKNLNDYKELIKECEMDLETHKNIINDKIEECNTTNK